MGNIVKRDLLRSFISEIFYKFRDDVSSTSMNCLFLCVILLTISTVAAACRGEHPQTSEFFSI